MGTMTSMEWTEDGAWLSLRTSRIDVLHLWTPPLHVADLHLGQESTYRHRLPSPLDYGILTEGPSGATPQCLEEPEKVHGNNDHEPPEPHSQCSLLRTLPIDASNIFDEWEHGTPLSFPPPNRAPLVPLKMVSVHDLPLSSVRKVRL